MTIGLVFGVLSCVCLALVYFGDVLPLTRQEREDRAAKLERKDYSSDRRMTLAQKLAIGGLVAFGILSALLPGGF